jgi:hypothetical protein
VVRGHVLERSRRCEFVFAKPQDSPSRLIDDYKERQNPDA